MRRGKKSLSQTPSPLKERIKGSKVNPKGSASSKSSASSIKLSDSIITTLEKKKDEYNKKHSKKVSLATLKAVFRRGSGAYSSSHRPTITGGVPNSRSAWAFARVNKFLLKKGGTKVKAAYVQDDDLMAKGGEVLDYFIHWTNKDGLENIIYENELNEESSLTNSLSLPFDRENNMPFGIKFKSSIKSKLDKVGDVVGVTELEQKFEYRTNEPIKIDEYFDGFIVRNNTNKSRLEKFLDDSFGFWNNEMLTKYYKSHNGYNISVSNTKFENGGLIAPNGKKSNLTPEQYKLVRTPQFKAWFGDWENDPQNASKVVDENGEPLVMWHYSKRLQKESDKFYIFNVDKQLGSHFGTLDQAQNIKYIESGKSEFQTPTKELSNFRYYQVFLNIKNPLRLKDEGIFESSNLVSKLDGYEFMNDRGQKSYYDRAKELAFVKGYDGVIYLNRYESNADTSFINSLDDASDEVFKREVSSAKDSWIAFYPYQIKLADGSNTTFDANNPDIRFDDGGLLKSLSMGMDILKKNGIVLKDENTIVIAYNSENQKIEPSLYNKALIYKSIKPIKSASNIIQKLDLQQYERFDEDKINEYKKGHLIILNQNEVIYDSENPNMRYKDGGEMGEEITCHNCGWEWNTDDSKKFDKYVCHKCGFDNKIYYMHKRGSNLPIGKLARGMSVSEVASVHGLEAKDIKDELVMGIKTEMEHTDKSEYARAIALDHLYEDPRYYTKLKKMEGLDKHYDEISKSYAEGGEINAIFSFKTPTGEPSKLNYIQQVLVRTNDFKKWFGDWEFAAKSFIRDNRENYEKHFKNVSKVIDSVTLEPRVVYHGTRIDDEFFDFDVTMEDKQGRPYAYFSYNKEYAQNFTQFSQRSTPNSKPFLYECFLSVKNPFMAITRDFLDKDHDAKTWVRNMTGQIIWDKYRTIQRDDFAKALESTIHGQVGKYAEKIYANGSSKFWKMMAADKNKDFKFFLIAYDYDGVFYAEEFSSNYDVADPSQFTYAVTIFDGRQVKLADGRNTHFDPMNFDIRYKDGGQMPQNIIENQKEQDMNKLQKLESIMMGGGQVMAEGGKVVGHGANPNDAKEGGFFKGRSHAEGGIKAINLSTNQPIEVEGGEVVITKKAVDDNTKREFEGKMMTNREILSHINQSGGGVSFAEGGHIEGSTCGCSGKKYKFGGEMLEDYSIVNMISKSTNTIDESKKYLSDFMSNIIK